ncbi:hypothetical protein [Comamonas sp.]|uniref:hypothetical protein n=1 Tax=Comamonas sp. TaxID=34028 RepID=UPI00289A1A44|nr:hypothetical protein [Comamonas sp.]
MKLIGIAKCMALGNAVFVGGLLYSDINGGPLWRWATSACLRAASSKALTGGSVLLCGNFDAKIRHFFVDGVCGVRERSGLRSIT